MAMEASSFDSLYSLSIMLVKLKLPSSEVSILTCCRQQTATEIRLTSRSVEGRRYLILKDILGFCLDPYSTRREGVFCTK